MLTLDYTLSLLNLQEVIVKKVTTNDKSAVIDIEMPKKQHTCPRCCAETSYVHDYRNRLIKDIPAFGMKIILNYRQRRKEDMYVLIAGNALPKNIRLCRNTIE